MEKCLRSRKGASAAATGTASTSATNRSLIPSRIVNVSSSSKAGVQRLEKGKIDRNSFGVYIGPKIVGKDFILEESIWANPWEKAAGMTAEQIKSRYLERLMSTPHLLKQLHELEGKILGHVAESDADFAASHGHVLVTLLKTHKKNITIAESNEEQQGCCFFYQSNSILSSYKKTSLCFLDYFFDSVEGLRAFLVGKEVRCAAYDVLQMELHRDQPSYLASMADNFEQSSTFQIFNMIRVMDYRFRKDIPFRNHCKTCCSEALNQGLGLCFVDCAGGSEDKFWGCGKFLNELKPQQPFLEFPGFNVRGWCLTLVTLFHHGIAPTNQVNERLPAPPANMEKALLILTSNYQVARDYAVVMASRPSGVIDPIYQGLGLVINTMNIYRAHWLDSKMFLGEHFEQTDRSVEFNGSMFLHPSPPMSQFMNSQKPNAKNMTEIQEESHLQ